MENNENINNELIKKIDKQIENLILDFKDDDFSKKRVKQIHSNILKVLNISSRENTKYYDFKTFKDLIKIEKNIRKKRVRDNLDKNDITFYENDMEDYDIYDEEIKNKNNIFPDIVPKKEKKNIDINTMENTVKDIQAAMLMFHKKTEKMNDDFLQMQNEIKSINKRLFDIEENLTSNDNTQKQEEKVSAVNEVKVVKQSNCKKNLHPYEISKNFGYKKYTKINQHLYNKQIKSRNKRK